MSLWLIVNSRDLMVIIKIAWQRLIDSFTMERLSALTLTVQRAAVIQAFVLRPAASEQCSTRWFQQFMVMVVSDFPLLTPVSNICNQTFARSERLQLIWLQSCFLVLSRLNGQREPWWDVWFQFEQLQFSFSNNVLLFLHKFNHILIHNRFKFQETIKVMDTKVIGCNGCYL